MVRRLLFFILVSYLNPELSNGFSPSSSALSLLTPSSSLRIATNAAERSLVKPTLSSLYSAISPDTKDDTEEYNIDDQRRARSLARRDRLARWRAAAAEEEEEVRDTEDNYFLLLGFLPTVLAFLSWENVSFALSEFIDQYGAVKSADGGQFANNLLRPTITGVVVREYIIEVVIFPLLVLDLIEFRT